MNTRPFIGRAEFRVVREPYASNYVALHAFFKSGVQGNEDVAAARGMVWQKLDPNEFGVRFDPAMELTPDEAQQLMDELWRAGLRPTEGAGSAGQMAATERHLADMRKMVFHALKLKQE